MRFPILSLVAGCLSAASALGQVYSEPVTPSISYQADVAAIQHIKDEWLKTERSTDIGALERIIADDFAGIGTSGPVPTNAELLKNLQAHAGQAPPYTVETSDMRIIVRGNTAVAAYTKTYSAKEHGNISHEDMTDVFTKSTGGWKLRISRSSLRQ